MQRLALVAPSESLRDLMVALAEAGTVELDTLLPRDGPPSDARRRLTALASGAQEAPCLSRQPPDLDLLERSGRVDLLAGEAELQEQAAQTVTRGSVVAAVGWVPTRALPELSTRLAEVGGAAVPLPSPPGVDPPSLLAPSPAAAPFTPLVETYAPVPYADVDPTLLAGIAYVLMFGMMFADVGHGLLLVVIALAIRGGRFQRLARFRAAWPFLAAAGAASAVFGLLYGEFFGPTGAVPVLWLDPLDHPVPLLAAAVGVGALLLAGAYVLGSINRWREGGWRLAVYAPTGIGGGLVFLGLGIVALGIYVDVVAVTALGAAVAVTGLGLSFAGLVAGAGRGAAAFTQASIELMDLLVRLGSNVISFARLAAFGLTHAALAGIVWLGAAALWGRGLAASAAAVVLFVVGNAVAFGLEALIAGIQALRLEYYELFSRIFTGEGRPFRPWRIPVVTEEALCLCG